MRWGGGPPRLMTRRHSCCCRNNKRMQKVMREREVMLMLMMLIPLVSQESIAHFGGWSLFTSWCWWKPVNSGQNALEGARRPDPPAAGHTFGYDVTYWVSTTTTSFYPFTKKLPVGFLLRQQQHCCCTGRTTHPKFIMGKYVTVRKKGDVVCCCC